MIYTHHDKMLSTEIHPMRIWRQGDFIAHVTHSPTDNIHKRWKNLVEYFEPFRYTCPSSVYENLDECFAEPCHDQLWEDDLNSTIATTFKFKNRWDDYVPQISPLELTLNRSMNKECDATFIVIPVKFAFPNGNYIPSVFRTHSTEHIKSRVLDFVHEAADLSFFLDTWQWIEHVINTRDPYFCMKVEYGLSRDNGRFNARMKNAQDDAKSRFKNLIPP